MEVNVGTFVPRTADVAELHPRPVSAGPLPLSRTIDLGAQE